MTIKTDFAHRSLDIHWPEGFKPEGADLFAHNELIIDASPEKIWSYLADVSNWPNWYPNSKDVELLRGPKMLGEGTVWRWNTFDSLFESRVFECVPYSRLGWFGYVPDSKPGFCHTWYIIPRGASCLVMTEEVGVGKEAIKIREADESMMHRGHDLWLAALKWISEK